MELVRPQAKWLSIAMRIRKTILLAHVHAVCLLAAAVSINHVASEPAVAQRFGRDDDDRRDGDRERRYGPFRRERSERDGDDEDRDEDREEERADEADSKASEKKSNDGSGLSAETFARGVMTKYDKNGDKWLEGDELKAAGSMTQAADADDDKKVTINELVAQTSANTASTRAAAKPTEPAQKPSQIASPSGSTSRSKSSTNSKRVYTWTGGGPAGEEKKAVRRTYRFTPAGEWLPSGLPSWFKSQDKNGDGQVLMSEYSRTWSRSTVSRFRGIDANDDGVITAKEAAAKK
jgi:hypothetical protein